MRSKVIRNKRAPFTEELAQRIQDVQLECCDALKLIRSRDDKNTLFYIDPPYVGSDQGHYDGYSSRIMEKQATSFTNVKLGRTARITASFKYHYSSPLWNKQLTVEAKENNWHQIELKMAKPMSAQTGKTVEKIEALTANYPIGVIDGEAKQL